MEDGLLTKCPFNRILLYIKISSRYYIILFYIPVLDRKYLFYISVVFVINELLSVQQVNNQSPENKHKYNMKSSYIL